MRVSRHQAIRIARAFLQQLPGSMPDGLDCESPTVCYERRGYGTLNLGMGETYWSVLFERVDQRDAVVNPGEVIIFVDEESGKAELFLKT